jgi:RNA polymerase sigma factor (sigma-70 family)
MEKPTNLDQPAKEESNEALLNRWHQHQDHEAFQVLHDRLVPGLRRFLRRQIETKFEGRGVTTDAVQDILQNVFKSVMRCRAPVRSVNGLLHKAAKRYLLKHVEKATAQMRDHHRTISWDSDCGPSGDYDGDGHDIGCNSLEDPKCAPARQQACIEAEEYVERLPPPEAEALRLVDLKEYTIPAAAKALNLSESTTWSRVRSARRRLKGMAIADDLAGRSELSSGNRRGAPEPPQRRDACGIPSIQPRPLLALPRGGWPTPTSESARSRKEPIPGVKRASGGVR